MPKAELNERQALFCKLYVLHMNASKAYREAYDREEGSPNLGREVANIMSKPYVQAEIKRLQEPYLEKLAIDTERTIEAIARVAFSDPRLLFKPDGSMIPPHELPVEIAMAIKDLKVKQKADGEITYEYTLNDRCKAHEQLAKHFGMFKPEEVNVNQRVSVVFE